MAGPTRKYLQDEFDKQRKKEAERLRREVPYDEGYPERVQLEKEMNRALKSRGNALQQKKQGNVPALSRVRYNAENGIDRDDLGLRTKKKQEYNRRVGATITRNLISEAFREKVREKVNKKK